MPAVKTKRISTLIESQLPEFISTEYQLFSKFLTKYYEQQEVQGGTLDIIVDLLLCLLKADSIISFTSSLLRYSFLGARHGSTT